MEAGNLMLTHTGRIHPCNEVKSNRRGSGIRTSRRSRSGVSTWLVLAAALLLLLPGVRAFAQYENGSLVGTIHDASGAAVAGAVVTITNTATAATSTVTTN